MNIYPRIKRINKDLPLPEYKTGGSVGFDLYAAKDTMVRAGEVILVSTNLIVETPKGYMLMLAPRSSLHKKHLKLANTIGIIDWDYSGNEDVLFMAIQNTGYAPYLIKQGERLCQGVFIPVGIAEWVEVDDMPGKSRGGYGSTGIHEKMEMTRCQNTTDTSSDEN